MFLKIKNNLLNKKLAKDKDKNQLIIISALENDKFEEIILLYIMNGINFI